MAVTGEENYTTTYTYDANNRLTQETKTGAVSNEVTVYDYDDSGNLLQKSTLGGAEFYEYNGFNQLVVLKQGEGGAAYGYNASGIRVSKQVGDTYTYYLLDGGDVVAECEDGSLSAIYTRGFNLVFRLTMDGMEFYLHDAHGDVIALTDGFGALVKTYFYDAFGNEENPEDSDTNPFRYCGEYFDNETCIYYLRARYYDPAIGRFTQQDTHWSPANMIYGDNPRKIYERQDALGLSTCTYAPEISAIMQSGNLYVYCVGNPLTYCDPSGFVAIALGLGAGAAFGSGITGSVQLVIDDKGNVGIITYISAQAGTPNLSWGGVLSISNADTIYDLEGASYVVGGSAGLSVGGGLEFAYATSPLSGKDVVAINISVGLGKLPVELHANVFGSSELIFFIRFTVGLYSSICLYEKTAM